MKYILITAIILNAFINNAQSNKDLYIEIEKFDNKIKVFEREDDAFAFRMYQIQLNTCNQYHKDFYFDEKGKLMRATLISKSVPIFRFNYNSNDASHPFKLVNELKLNKLYYPSDFHITHFDSLKKVFKEATNIYVIVDKKENGVLNRYAYKVSYSLLSQL